MVHNYYGKNRINSISFAKNLVFAWNRIKYLYPLYIITTLLMVIFMFVGKEVEPVLRIAIKFFLNVLLLQSWFPMDGSNVNGVSWYLSVMPFLYFLFPWILRSMEKNCSISKAKKILGFLVFSQIVVGFISSHLPSFCYTENSWVVRDLTWWIVYVFPLTRLLDFLIGCNLGYCFKFHKPAKISKGKYIFIELITIVLIFVGEIAYVIMRSASMQTERWWTYVAVFTISSCMVIWIFADDQGYISKYLINRFTLYLGNISPFSFLIHPVVLYYLGVACTLLVDHDFSIHFGGWIKVSLGFMLTIAATKIWMIIIHKQIKY